jgi:hypothetical protein
VTPIFTLIVALRNPAPGLGFFNFKLIPLVERPSELLPSYPSLDLGEVKPE